MTMNITDNTLTAIKMILADTDPNKSMRSRYKSCLDTLEQMESGFSQLPEDFENVLKMVKDVYKICETRFKLLDCDCHYYDDRIPEHLLKVKGIKEYFTALVLYEIEQNIDKVFPNNYEYIESDAIESVIKAETLENCE